MADDVSGALGPVVCAHLCLEKLDPLQELPLAGGWVCMGCGESGPTVLSVETGPVSHEQAALFGRCVCGDAWRWPRVETGTLVAAWLARHAGCRERRSDG